MAHEAICKIDNCKICKELLRLKCENVQGLIGNENNRYSCVDSSRSLCEKDKLKSPCESLIRKNPSKLLTKMTKILRLLRVLSIMKILTSKTVIL